MTLVDTEPVVGWTLIVAERTRQIVEEQHSLAGDDEYVRGELRAAARCYILAQDRRTTPPRDWPWTPADWKPRDRASNLLRAAALLLAEADRLARAGHLPAAEAARTEARYLGFGLTKLLAASTARSALPTPKDRP